jgi:hypothetical protein
MDLNRIGLNAAQAMQQPVATDEGVEVAAQRPASGMDEYLALAKALYPDVEAPAQMEQGKGFQFNIPGMEIPGVSPAIGAIPFVGKRLRGAIKKGFKPGMSGGMLDAVAQSILGSLQTMPEASGVGESFAKGLATGFGAVRGKDIEERKKRYEEGIAAKKEALKNQRTFAGDLAKTAFEYGLKPKPEGKRMVTLTPQLREWMKANAKTTYPPDRTEIPYDEMKATVEEKGGIDTGKRFDMAYKVFDNWTSKPIYKQMGEIAAAKAATDAILKSNSPNTDKFLLAQVNKFVDPDSVIRDTEIKFWQMRPGLAGKVRQWMTENRDGRFLSEQDRADLIGIVNDIYNARRAVYEKDRAGTMNFAGSFGLDLGSLIPDIADLGPSAPVAVPGADRAGKVDAKWGKP